MRPQHAISRFAPSPTGLLHVGHAFAALQLAQWAKQYQGKVLLRIEDIDRNRCKAEWATQMIEDLQWLGWSWHGNIRWQSRHMSDYQDAAQRLQHIGVLYPCFCTRKQHAPHARYPGDCRELSPDEQSKRMQYERFAWRLHIQRAQEILSRQTLSWYDDSQRHSLNMSDMDDVVIVRKDIGVSYHLAVVVDDALQGVTHVVRGEDLRDSTPIHVLLQHLLHLPTPHYRHHALLRHPDGHRLAKSKQSISLKSLRQAGVSPAMLRHYLNHCQGHWAFPQSASAEEIAQQLGSHA